MDTNTSPKKTVHHGRNVKCLRELLNKNQKMLADDLNITQQALSQFERQEEISEQVLQKIAKALNIPIEAIKNLTEENANNMVTNTFYDFKDNAAGNGSTYSGGGEFNVTNNCSTADKLAELYDKLLADKDDTVKRLEKILVEMNEKFDRYRE